jgi:hypothetical protein
VDKTLSKETLPQEQHVTTSEALIFYGFAGIKLAERVVKPGRQGNM